MNRLKVNKTGLAFGGFFAVIHAIWAIMVAIGVAQISMDWIFGLHFINLQYSMAPFSIGTAIALVVVTGIVGYICGIVLAWIWNCAHK
jgi:hypothetical protein